LQAHRPQALSNCCFNNTLAGSAISTATTTTTTTTTTTITTTTAYFQYLIILSCTCQNINNPKVDMVIIRVSLMVFFAWLASFFLGQAAFSQSQQVAKYNRAGFFPYLKRFPALPSQYLKRSDMNNVLGIGVKRDDDQFDREDRDYRPLMFGKRYPDYQLPMFALLRQCPVMICNTTS
ncbi:hypothetical protein T4D_5098, partial [Trichinella pseudospiralis]